MPGSPRQSGLPPPIFLEMSSATSDPMPHLSPLPVRAGSTPSKSLPAAPVNPHPRAKEIKHRLKIQDLTCKGSREFLDAVNAGTVVGDAVVGVLGWLYSPETSPPGTRSVTLVLRSMDGVAYTTGKDIDNDHKEIHFSTDYIAGISDKRKQDEILGVICHEMVHCFQFDAFNSAPGGLIEGIADWVRLRSGLAPPHWKRSAGSRWDAGYSHTGYFLEYLEQRFGPGSIRRVNEDLREKGYKEETFWTGLFGHEVTKLWEDYRETLDEERDIDEEAVFVPKEDGRDGEGKPKSDTSGNTGTQNCIMITDTRTVSGLADCAGHIKEPSRSVTPEASSIAPETAPKETPTPKRLADMLWSEFYRLRWEIGQESDGYMAFTFVYYFETLLGRLHPDLSDADKVALLLSKLPLERQSSLHILSDLLQEQVGTAFKKPWSFEKVKELLVRSGQPDYAIRNYRRLNY